MNGFMNGRGGGNVAGFENFLKASDLLPMARAFAMVRLSGRKTSLHQ